MIFERAQLLAVPRRTTLGLGALNPLGYAFAAFDRGLAPAGRRVLGTYTQDRKS